MEQRTFSFDDVCLFPEEQIGLHTQDTWEISWVIIGSGTWLVGDVSEPFQSGDVVMIPPGMPHCWYFDKDPTDGNKHVANITMTFGDGFLRDCPKVFPELAAPLEKLRKKDVAIKFGNKKADAISALLMEMRGLEAAERIPLMLKVLLAAVSEGEEQIIGKCNKIGRKQQQMDKVRIYVICNAGRHITLDDVAHHVGMCRAAFCVFFKKATGKTFVQYLNEYRVEQACRLLAQKSMNVSEVCYHVGFNNVPYFNRLFKRMKGKTPTECY